MRILAVLLLALLFAWVSKAEFQPTNLSVAVDVNPDGTALVTETVRISMDSGSPVIYDTAMSANDLTSWRAKTKLDLRFHFNRDAVDISDVSVRAQPRDNCEGCVRDICTVCYGTLIIRYKLSPIINKTDSGLFRMNQFKPRTTNFSMNPDALSFESSGQGGMVLPENTRFSINIPAGALITFINPIPEGLQGLKFPTNNVSSFSWEGRMPLSNFELTFQTEEPLSVEVMGFFSSLRDDLLKILFSREGLAIVVILAIVLASIIVLRRRAAE